MSKNKSGIRKVLYNEVTIVVSVVLAVIGFVNYVVIPITILEEEIKNLKGNHIVHIDEDIEEINETLKKHEENNIDIIMKLERISAVLEEHDKKAP